MLKEMVAALGLALIVAWALVWSVCAWVDDQHCTDHGAKYHSTSVTLRGYCSVTGVKVPAWLVGR